MSAANLDEIKKKYKFKEISIATWRDPSLSVHPVRGGPDSPSFSPNATFVPTYKTNYDFTDDEGSVSEADDEADREAPIDSTAEDWLDEPPVVEQEQESPVEQPPEEGQTFETEDQVDEVEQIDEFQPQSNEVDQEPNMAGETDVDKGEPIMDAAIDGPGEEDHPPPESGDADPTPLEPADDAAEADVAPPSDTGSDERRVSFAPGTPDPKPTQRKKKAAKGTKGKKKRIAVPIDSLPADVMAMIDGAFDGLPPPPPPAAPEPPVDDDVVVEDGTQDIDPVDPQADPEPPPAEEPVAREAVSETASDEPPPEEGSDIPGEAPAEAVNEDVPGAQEAEKGAQDMTAAPPPEPSQADETIVEPTDEAPVVLEKPAKKKGSKSGKDKDKSKKKSSKTKSRDLSPLPAGLGIEIPPPPPPLPVDDVTGDAQAPALEDAQEPLPDTLPTEEAEKTGDGKQDEIDPEPANENQDGSAETSPQSAENEPKPDETLSAEHAGEPGDEDSAQNEAATEPKEIDEQNTKDEDTVPDAWDDPENMADSPDPSPPKKESHDEQAVTEESASSPADSGVEFEDDGSKAANEVDEAKDPAPIEDPEPGPDSAADRGEQTDTNTSAENEATDEPVADATGAAEEAADSKAGETQVETAEGGEGEQAPEEVAAEPDEASKEEPRSDESPAEATTEDATEETSAEPPTEQTPEEAAGNKEIPLGDNDGDVESKTAVEDDPPRENAEAEPEPSSYEPPSVESVTEEAKVDPFEFEVVASPEEEVGAELQEETRKEVESVPEVPPSPVLSKSDSQGSQKHKADHWERKHADNALKEVFEDSKVLERSHSGKDGKSELRVRDRHRKHRRLSSSGEDDSERRRRRTARKAAEAAALAEEASRKAEDERKHQERRAARRRATDESDPRKAEERRERHRSRESDPGQSRTTRPLKTALPFALPAIPKALNLASGESVHGTAVIRSHGGAYRPAAKETARVAPPTSAPRDDAAPTEVLKETRTASPPSSGGEKSHHRHRHRRHRSDGERSSRTDKESDRHRRRPPLVEERVQERPRSFLGLVRI